MSGRFLGHLDEPEEREGPDFRVLSSQGSSGYIGLETFENPGCSIVSYVSDEVVSKCPITGQPDFYTVEISLRQTERLIESKSLKIWFQNLITVSFTEDFGIFCEALAVHIRDCMCQAVGCSPDECQVALQQKSRGGISISAVA